MRSFRYRVTHGEGPQLVVFRGVVHCDEKACSDGHIRGRIITDIMKRALFNWVEVYDVVPEESGKAIA